MRQQHILIIGGGLAGLAAGCYARRSGYRTTIVEHNLALGGVCTAWPRGPYVVDGCIHWLTGGPFEQLYEELEIVPTVQLRTLDTWATYRDARDGFEISFTRDLDALVSALAQISNEDAAELARMRRAVSELIAMKPPIDAPKLASFRDTVRSFWEMRAALGAFLHYRKPIGVWTREHLASDRLRRIFGRMFPDTAPMLFLLMVLGYLERGYLSRPVGGTTAFRDALVHTYRSLGGEVQLHATVDEVLVRAGRAHGVRLADGTMLKSDIVLSTASAPETVLRLLGGRYDGDATRTRLESWKLFDPIVLVSFGVAHPYASAPNLLTIDAIEPLEAGGRANDRLSVRVCNDDRSFAPAGHSVVQAMVPTGYDWWATRGERYGAEKDAFANAILSQLEQHFPDMRAAVRMVDVATPLTYWSNARSWRGAYEGWMPSGDSFMSHLPKKLDGLERFYMAGQWVEPGGGVPMALLSGRQAIQLLCADDGCRFVASSSAGTAPAAARAPE